MLARRWPSGAEARHRRCARVAGLARTLLLAALAVGLAACGRGEVRGGRGGGPGPGGGPPPPSVEIVRVEPQLLRNVVAIPGQLASERAVELRPEIEGILASADFEEGEYVAEGAVLFRLRDDEQRARVREAEAELALAAATWRRTRTLARQNVSSEAQLERAAAERDVARARVEAAKVALAKTVIRAPFDGVVGARLVDPGDHVDNNVPLGRIDAVDRLQLLFTLPEIALGLVRPGIPVRIRVAPFPDERFDGEVYFVAPTLNAEARNFLLKAWIPNPDRRLRPGLFAEIDAEIERKEDALMVPESALLHALDGTFVWRIDGESRAERVAVRTGLSDDGRVEILSGLEPGDRIVAAGVHKVDEGAPVVAAPRPEAGPRTTAEDPAPNRGES